MKIEQLKIEQVRNLSAISLTPNPQFNILYGANGSGKTSCLEAIYLLGFGRSFRTRQINRLIRYHQSTLTVFAQIRRLGGHFFSMGIEKSLQHKPRLKLGGEVVNTISQLASTLPLQLIHPESFQLLNAGPEERRKFIDWGVFHVEPGFLQAWQCYHRALKQRNALLRQFPTPSWQQIQVWTQECSKFGEQLNQFRMAYSAQLLVTIQEMLGNLLPVSGFDITFKQGWCSTQSLAEAFEQSWAQDKQFGYTRVGPQRADLSVTVQGYPASQILSRGQQKLLICILYFSQTALLRHLTNKPSIFLLDDLMAELDASHRQQIIQWLATFDCQAFITGVEPAFLEQAMSGHTYSLFHVQQGQILS
jgi:DNA replication and repair protein RecF